MRFGLTREQINARSVARLCEDFERLHSLHSLEHPVFCLPLHNYEKERLKDSLPGPWAKFSLAVPTTKTFELLNS